MKLPSKLFRKQDGKSSLSPISVLGLIVVVTAGTAVLVTWKPWEQSARATPSNANATSSVSTNPVGTSTATATNTAPASNDVVTLMNEGTELIARGDTEGAIQKYRAAMKINPEDEEVYFNLAFA